jgi:thiamine pyrophosphate-dependent acetolactate synthase large subunit-like protein
MPPTSLTPSTRYEDLANALGGRGYLCKTPAEVTKALKAALAETSVPSVVFSSLYHNTMHCQMPSLPLDLFRVTHT